MRKKIFSLLFLLAIAGMINAQDRSATKHYPAGTFIGDAQLIEEWTESNGKQSTAVYVVDIRTAGSYFIKATTNMQKDNRQVLSADDHINGLMLTAQTNGWQQTVAGVSGGIQPIVLTTGRHTIRFTMNGNMPPLNDGISLSRSNTHTKLDADWQNFSTNLDRLKAVQPMSTVPADKSNPASTEKVLSNPAGNYDHAVDTAFGYSTFSYVHLTAGVSYTFNTYSSTVDPVLHLFDPGSIDTRTWYNDDGGGGWESSLTVLIPATGYYCLLARPYFGGQSGITNIKQNGVDYYTNTAISGLRFYTTIRTGDLNYFTTRLAGTNPDTRIFTLVSAGGSVTGYNDDYFNNVNGTWNWGLASRIKKNYSSGSSIVFVCAYNSAYTGNCDVYMGNLNGQLPNTEPANFPLFKTEDAIQSAPVTGYVYNCISWSGGITSSWSWPPDATSSWYVAGNELAGFDKFYSNTPVRYPGAWNYTRSGATSANAVVDLWKRASGYQHASVTKPGNAHPHGYDWESKPGGLDRQFHPRNALENANWYGSVTNYYKATGTFAKNSSGRSFETDADAIAAGVAVYENAKLSSKANDKLNNLLGQTATDINSSFDRLYENWKQTWAANASLSDPYAYCKNKEYEALEAYCNKNGNAAMLLVFKKYTNGDHLTTKLLWDLTRSRFAPLLDEAKNDILNNPYDERGRVIIHGDHDNGVRYIEKIIKQLDIKPVDITPADVFTVTVSPNPVKDILTVTVAIKESSRISVNAVSSQTGTSRLLQTETTVTPGTHQYRLNVKGFAGAAGDMIIVQVKVNGVLQTMKVLVGN